MTETEIWKPVVGFEEFYHVSNLGRLKSFRGKTERFITGSIGGVGYYQVFFSRTHRQMVHRAVADAFLDPPPSPDHTVVNHIDGCKTNNRADNLEWVTPSGNCLHAHRTGLHKRRYSDEEILEIRRLSSEERMSYNSIARTFGMCPITVSRIVRRFYRKNVVAS